MKWGFACLLFIFLTSVFSTVPEIKRCSVHLVLISEYRGTYLTPRASHSVLQSPGQGPGDGRIDFSLRQGGKLQVVWPEAP